ncbi:MAG: hypothetical protein AUH85_00145 [Chloroflexi bacterium 13_1_40CM_4_68_4]|nr:MAG: hypothetical protein AUH85_00145 [Chloroflexi bacterium 13_1_40CM_4_68_4]
MIVIGNDSVERRVSAGTGGRCTTTALINKRTGRDYIRAPSLEFSLSLDGVRLDASDFTVENVETSARSDRAVAALHLRSEQPPLEVELQLLCYANHAVIRKRLVITNRDTLAHTIADLDWENLELLIDSPAATEVWLDHFTRREKSALINMDDCALLVRDVALGEGFIISNEAPGPLKRIEVYARDRRVAVGYNRDDETIFERVLAPGESVKTPAAFILTFATRVPQDAIDREYGAFVAEHLTACDPRRVPSITINTWQPHEFAIDRALLLEQIDLAAELGVDAYQVDAGWYDRMGDWSVDRAKFAGGLEEIADHCRARGMRFGLWIAAATVDEESAVALQHPDWLMRDASGESNRHPIPGAITMCLDTPYAGVISGTISRTVERYGVELLKLDLSSVRNLYEPGRYTGCFASGHGHRSSHESHARIVDRLLELVSSLKRAHPECLIDLSYELYGVMDGTDLALTQVADQNWFTNLASPYEQSLRREIYQRGRVTRPWTLNFGGAVLDHPSGPHYGLFSTMTAHAMFWGDLRRLDEATRAHYRKWFAWIRAQRAYSDFYRYYLVSDVFPVPDAVAVRDYRRAIPTSRYGIAPSGIHPAAFEPQLQSQGESWDGVARLDANGEGPIFLFRPASSRHDRFQLRVPWVHASARYRIEDATAERVLGTFTGSELRETGVPVRIAEPERAAVLVLRRA